MHESRQGEELTDFLEESAQQGTFCESGELTHSPEEAWKRLQRSLPRPEYWILKLVQVAVSWKAERLCVTTDSDNITVDFDVPASPDLTPSNLLEAEYRGRGLQHLRVALAGACSDPKVNVVEFSWNNAGTAAHFEWAKGELTTSQEPSVSVPRATLQIKLHHQELSWFMNIFGQAPFSLEREALSQRARTCPIPILIDSEIMTFEDPEPEQGPLLVSERFALPSGGTASLRYLFHRQIVLPRYLDWMTSNNNRIRPRPPYGSHLPSEQSERLLWVCDGVLVDEWQIDNCDSAVAAVMELPAEDLTLDLTGFALQKDQKSLARVAETRSLRRGILQNLEAQLAELLGHRELKSEVYNSVWGRHLLVGVLFPPYLLFGTVELFRLPTKTKSLLEADLALCRSHLKRRLEQLQDDS